MYLALIAAAAIAAALAAAGAAHAQEYVGHLRLDPPPAGARAFETVAFTGKLTADGGRPVSGSAVYVMGSHGGGPERAIGTAFTDEAGAFEARWSPHVSDAGRWEFRAVYNGGPLVGPAESRAHQTEVVRRGEELPAGPAAAPERQGTSVLLYGVPENAAAGERVTFYGKLTSAAGDPLGHRRIYVMADAGGGRAERVAHATTTAGGYFAAEWAGGAGPAGAEVAVYAAFAGEAGHGAARSPVQRMAVLGGAGSLTLDPLPASAAEGDAITVSGTLSGAGAPGAVIYIMDEDRGRPDDLLATAYAGAGGRFSAEWRVTAADAGGDVEVYALAEGASGRLASPVQALQVLEPDPWSPGAGGGSYLELLYVMDLAGAPHVAIVPAPDSYDAARRHIVPVQEGILTWTHELERRYGGDWGVTFEVVEPGSRWQEWPDVVVNLVTPESDAGCADSYAGRARPGASRPVQAYVCSSAGGLPYADHEVRRTAAHEFIHAMGLGHAFGLPGDMMCSAEGGRPTCPPGERSGAPTHLDLAAVARMYGTDGFARPNGAVEAGERLYADGAPPAAPAGEGGRHREAVGSARCDGAGPYLSRVDAHVLGAGWYEWHTICKGGTVRYAFSATGGFGIHVLPPETDVERFMDEGEGSYYTCEDPDELWKSRSGACSIRAGSAVVVYNPGGEDIRLRGIVVAR